jgi:hypothetical protein
MKENKEGGCEGSKEWTREEGVDVKVDKGKHN